MTRNTATSLFALLVATTAGCGTPDTPPFNPPSPTEPPAQPAPPAPPAPCIVTQDNSDVRFAREEVVLPPGASYDLALTIDLRSRSQCGLTIETNGPAISASLDRNGDFWTGRGEIDIEATRIGTSTIDLLFERSVIDTVTVVVEEPTGAFLAPALFGSTHSDFAVSVGTTTTLVVRYAGPSGNFNALPSPEANNRAFAIADVRGSEHLSAEFLEENSEAGSFTAFEAGEHTVDVVIRNGLTLSTTVRAVNPEDIVNLRVVEELFLENSTILTVLGTTADGLDVVGLHAKAVMNGEELDSLLGSVFFLLSNDELATSDIQFEWDELTVTRERGVLESE